MTAATLAVIGRIVFGGFFLVAAWRFSSGEVVGLQGDLQKPQPQPYRWVLLAIVALCLFSLGIYNLTSLCGLMGPVRRVCAMVGTAIERRVAEGEEIAARLEITTENVRAHLKRIYTKLGVHTRTEAAVKHLRRERLVQSA